LTSKREEGALGEKRAVETLTREGYKIVEKNYRSPFGEIDIIAEEDDYLVFIEVKKRNTMAFGSPFEAVSPQKKRHIIRSAMFYMKKHRCFDRKVRFDVVGVESEKVRILKHAFMAE
jgi:putative endonuclease